MSNSISLKQKVFALVGILVLGAVMVSVTPAQAREERPSRSDIFESRDLGRSTAQASFVAGEVIVKRRGSESFEKVALTGFDTVPAALSRISRRGDIEYAEPNYIANAFFVPNDTYYSFQWHFDNNVSGGIDTEQAWDVTNGSGIIVAIVDTGVAYETYTKRRTRYYKAPDLAGTSFTPGYDFVENDKHPNDDNGHGTHVAGTIAQSTNNGSGTAGIAYGASIMPVKVLDKRGSGSYADVAAGIRFAVDNGAKVINLSLGGSASASYLEDAVRYAYENGVTVVAAAGNDGTGTVSYPAAYDAYVIAVGATRYDEARAPYSNYGTSLDIMAPGGDTSVDQNGDGYGDGVLQQTFGNSFNSWGYYFYQGTSMATPHVVGVAALVLSNGNATTPDEVREALTSTAKDLGPAGRDNGYGYGLLNAAAALTYSSGTTPPPPPPPPPNQAPTADAGADQEALTGETVQFDGSNSSDSDGSIVSYDWSFGDSSVGSGVTPSHSYANAGDYAVTLTVTDDGGLIAQDTLLVTVSDPEPEPPTPPPSVSTLHVGDITFTYSKRDGRRTRCRVTATIPALNDSGSGVSSTAVNGSWSGAYRSSVSGTTGSSGTMSFTTSWVRNCGEFIFTVNDLTKDGWEYDATQNIETSDSINL